MRKVLTAGLAVAFAAPLGLAPALGQEAGDEGGAQADVLAMTCADLAALDAETGAGIIHYMAGYSDGQRAAIAAAGPAVPEGDATDDGQAAADAAASEGTGATDDSAGGGQAMADASGAGTSGAAAGLGIQVDQVLAACAEAPDSPAAEVLNVARGAAQAEVDSQDEDPAAEGEDGQDVGSGNAVVE